MTFDEAEKLMEAGLIMRCTHWHQERAMRIHRKVHWFCDRKGKMFQSSFVLGDEMDAYKNNDNWEKA
jgi:hypothetical protein